MIKQFEAGSPMHRVILLCATVSEGAQGKSEGRLKAQVKGD
jgi:hypothetical protein